jgi:hypothetical protein
MQALLLIEAEPQKRPMLAQMRFHPGEHQIFQPLNPDAVE